jgi:hypothetical protein
LVSALPQIPRQDVRHVYDDGIDCAFGDESTCSIRIPVVRKVIHQVPGFVGRRLEIAPHFVIRATGAAVVEKQFTPRLDVGGLRFLGTFG